MGELTAYVDGLAPERAAALRHIIDLALDEAPGAIEGMSYGMPALKVAGKPLIGVIAAKAHLSVFPFSGAVVEQVAGRLPGYSLSKGTIRFTPGTPLPDDVIRDIVRLRLAELGHADGNPPVRGRNAPMPTRGLGHRAGEHSPRPPQPRAR